ncbi:MAG: hypothetical protein FJY54_03535 [Betaproteobacteria bacterium]|nr:hypothetical protein [Betaproteobacteria bacterium]
MRYVTGPARAAALIAVMWFAGAAAAAQPAAPIRVFDTGELTLDRYTVVRRVWADTWRSAFWIPGQPDAGAAIAALGAEAARAGADAIVNVHCLNDEGAWFSRGYYCYGLAIKLR